MGAEGALKGVARGGCTEGAVWWGAEGALKGVARGGSTERGGVEERIEGAIGRCRGVY